MCAPRSPRRACRPLLQGSTRPGKQKFRQFSGAFGSGFQRSTSCWSWPPAQAALDPPTVSFRFAAALNRQTNLVPIYESFDSVSSHFVVLFVTFASVVWPLLRRLCPRALLVTTMSPPTTTGTSSSLSSSRCRDKLNLVDRVYPIGYGWLISCLVSHMLS